MRKLKFTNDDLKEMRDSAVLLHGVFPKTFFAKLSKQSPARIFVLEGRPHLQAANTSTFELNKRGITPILISDNMAGLLFYKGILKEVWVAYHHADKTGVVCCVGALILAILAKTHQVPFFCYPSGKKNKNIGQPKDILSFKNIRIAPKGTKAYVPLSEWVSRSLIKEVFK